MLRHTLSIFLSLLLFQSRSQDFNAVIQKGHGEVVKAVQFTEDGQFLLTASRDKSARLWDVQTGKEMRSYLGHEHTVNGLAIYKNQLATSSADGSARVWELSSGKLLKVPTEKERFLTSITWSPDGKYLAIGSYEDSVDIFETERMEILKRIRVNTDRGTGYGVQVRFSPDSKYLSIGEDQRTARIFKTSDWTEIAQFTPEEGYCGGCGTLTAFSPDSRSLLKVSNNHSLEKFSIETGELLFSFGEDFDDSRAVDFHSSDDYFLVATQDSLFVFDKNNQLLLGKGFEGEIEDAIFHPTEPWVAIALEKIVLLIDLEGKSIRRFEGILNSTYTGLDYDIGQYWERFIAKWIKYKPARMFDHGGLFVGKTGFKARKWNVQSASIDMEYIGHEQGIISFERVNDNTIVSGGGDGRLIVWDETTGKVIKSIKGHREPIFDLALSNNGKLLAAGSWDGVISIWNTRTWEKINSFYKEGASAYTLAFSSNDSYLVTGLLDKTLRLMEIKTGRFVRELVGHTEPVTSIQIREDQILTSSWDGQIITWDWNSGLITDRIQTSYPVFGASWVGNEIVTAGSDRSIHFWDAKGKLVQSLDGHQAEITGLEVDGKILMTTDVDGVTRLWDISTRSELYEHIQIGKNDWMVKTPEGYFDGTDAAISNIHFVRGMEVIGASQVMDRYYQPGLVEQLFKKQRKGPSLGQAVDDAPPPVLKLNALPVKGNTATLFLKIQDAGGGIENIRLYHNGKRVAFQERAQSVRSEAKEKVYSIDFQLISGINRFSATASSKTSLVSSSPEVTLYSNSKEPASTCHILAVGINEYSNQALNLNYARPDASSFASKMKSKSEAIHQNVVLHQLFDTEATKDGILLKLSKLREEIAINDVFIFYYAGHGSMIDNKFYLVSSEANRLYDDQVLDQYGVEASVLQEAMKEIKALKQVIIMDACQSGGSVEVLAQRGVPEEKAIAQLSRSSGIHVLAAAGSDQYATEFDQLGHGLFTYVLLEGINGAADGAPKDGKVTIYELKSFLDDQVPEMSIQYKGSPQYPNTFSRGQDFPIVLIEP